MLLDTGTRLGPYEIIAPLGAGGMGEVYRAKDTRLDRIVALKVLTGALADDPESRQRFEQEARAIAALNDPHICTIHDVGRHGDVDYLVLEFLEGETLADRLKRSPALTIDEALALAIQIGDGLDRAHGAGIAHRDLKPGNAMLLRRGGTSSVPTVKLLDFGLAAWTTAARPHAIDPSLGQTISASMVATKAGGPRSTMSGFSGTVQYMGPEQLDGDPGDHRADIFAFGCVLYEMLAGRKAFEGTNALTAIAAIMNSEPPPIAALQSAHPLLDHVMRRCLEKDRERRWQNIRDVTGELRWIVDHPVAASLSASGTAPGSTSESAPGSASAATSAAAVAAATAAQARSRGVARAAVGAAIVLAIVAATAGAFALRGRGAAAPDLPTLRFEIGTTPTDDPSIALSPDGRHLAFVANQDRVPMLWVRALDAIDSRALPGTQGARFPFWSPDGRTLGFFADDKLKRIDVAGGTPIVMADAPNARGGSWNADGTILFAPGVTAPLMRASTRGGAAERVTQLNTGSGPAHRWPQFLPDGKRFLFSSTLGTADTNGVYIGSLDNTPPVRLVPAEGAARFVPPDTLLAIRQGALQAYHFNAASAAVEGEPTMIAQGFAGAASNGGAFATSDTGVLAYRAAGTAQRRQLVWVNRQGAVLRTIGDPESDFIASPELSADEQHLLVFMQRTGDNDVWVIELARNLARRVTDGPPADAHPVWDPDGQHVVFSSGRFGSRRATRQAVSGGKAGPLFAKDMSGQVLSWTRDRQHVLLRRDSQNDGADLVALSIAGDPPEIVIAQTQADETEGQFSPDGRWVAFVSNEGGRPDVFVQSFPEGQARTQVSTAGGTQVRWSHDGTEIYYIAPDGKMTAAPITFGRSSGAAPANAVPVVKLPLSLFQTHLATGTNVVGNKAQYAVSRDGRFLLNTAIESASAPIVVSVNWMKKPAK